MSLNSDSLAPPPHHTYPMLTPFLSFVRSHTTLCPRTMFYHCTNSAYVQLRVNGSTGTINRSNKKGSTGTINRMSKRYNSVSVVKADDGYSVVDTSSSRRRGAGDGAPRHATRSSDAAADSNSHLPGDWEELHDPKSGNMYFHNRITGETTWERSDMWSSTINL